MIELKLGRVPNIKLDFKLYLITSPLPRNATRAQEKSLEKKVEIALQSGVKAIQLREKNWPDRKLWRQALIFRKLTRRYPAQFFLNDRLDISLLAEADGIHLPEDGLPVKTVRSHLPEKLIGKSVHSLEKAEKAEQEGADFLVFGPVFPTPSKEGILEPRGLPLLEKVTSSVGIPVLAIGGIQSDSAKDCLDCGAYGVAVISAIFNAKNIPSAVAAFQKALHGL